MNVTEVMMTSVKFLDAAQSVLAAARIMKKINVGCLLVGSRGHAVGIVTDRDIAIRAVASGDDISSVTIAEVMTPDPMFCWVSDSIEQAVRIMQDNRVRRLPVLNKDRTVAGIVSISDISNHVSYKVTGKLLDTLSSPADYVSI